MVKKLITAASLALLAASSFAATPGTLYAGVDAGSTKIERVSDKPTSVGGFVGYNFSQHWAVEAAARRLGSADVPGGDLTLTQASVSVIGTVALGKGFDLFGRVGYGNLDVDNSSRFVTVDNGNTSGGEFAVGFAYHFTPTVAGRIELQQIATEVSNVSAGIVFSF